MSLDYIFVPTESHKAYILPSVGLFFLFFTTLFHSASPEGKTRFLQLSLSFCYRLRECYYHCCSQPTGPKYTSPNHQRAHIRGQIVEEDMNGCTDS